MSKALLDRVARHAAEAPDRAAYVATRGGAVMTYRDLWEHAQHAASLVREAMPGGGAVLLRSANRPEVAAWFLGVMGAGVDVFPVPVSMPPSQVVEVARLAGVRVVAGSDLSDFGFSFHPLHFAKPQAAEPPPLAASQRNSGDLLLVSSGSTGAAKVVRRTGTSVDAVSEAMVEALGIRPADRVLACLPLSHSYGLEHGLLAPLWAGATVVLADGFDLPTVAAAFAGGVNVFPAVPAMVEALGRVDVPGVAAARAVYTAGAPLPAEVSGRFFDRHGVRVGQVYGMTEIGSVTYNDPSDSDFDPASVGRPMGGVSVRIVGEGEVAVRAASMFAGYVGLRRDESHWADGHFLTGDLGRLDAGRLTITGRERLLIETGGLKVNPLEVEAVLASHPAVADVAVVAVRQTEAVRRLRAVVVPRDPSSPPAGEALRAFARQRLAAHQVPRWVEFRADLPRTATGKIARHLLEEA